MYFSMYREKKKNTPEIPTTLAEFQECIYTFFDRYGTLNGTDFYKITLGDEKKTVVFVADQLVKELKNAKDWNMDGTFKCVPRLPKAQQLFTIMASAYDHVRFKQTLD